MLLLNSSPAQTTAEIINTSPTTKDVIITVAGYGLALALVATVFYFLYRYFYKKDRDKDPMNRLGKF